MPGHLPANPFTSSIASDMLQYCHSILPGSAFGLACMNAVDDSPSITALFLFRGLTDPLVLRFCSSLAGDSAEEGLRLLVEGGVATGGIRLMLILERSVAEPSTGGGSGECN